LIVLRIIILGFARFFVTLPTILKGMGRILAIDYGRKRVGLAVTDPLKIAANPLETVAVHEVMTYLKNYLQKESVETIVVGKALQMSGDESESMQLINPFAEALKKNFPEVRIVFADERFSSVLAQRTILEAGMKKKDRQNKALVDKVAATIILQTYLESNL